MRTTGDRCRIMIPVCSVDRLGDSVGYDEDDEEEEETICQNNDFMYQMAKY